MNKPELLRQLQKIREEISIGNPEVGETLLDLLVGEIDRDTNVAALVHEPKEALEDELWLIFAQDSSGRWVQPYMGLTLLSQAACWANWNSIPKHGFKAVRFVQIILPKGTP